MRVFMGVAMVALAVLAGWLGQMVGDRDPPTVITHVEVNSVKPWPGGEVHVRYNVRRFRQCATRVERVLYDAVQLRVPLPTREFATSPGPTGDDYAVAVPIPTTVTPGPATYRIITSYACNVLHNLFPIIVQSPDVHFTIEAAPP